MRVDLPAVASGAVVAATGLGAMSLFWALEPRNADLAGLTDYLSATWGDGIFLPIAAAAATSAVRSLPAADGERVVAIAAAAVGFGLGVATQLVWLLDKSPNLNWTLPEPHKFNAPGIYHAGFLIATSAYAAGLGALAIKRWRSARDEEQRAKARVALVVAASAVAGFVGLLVVDNVGSAGTMATRATTAATIIGAGCAVGLLRRTKL